ncbi:hypothetical protein [Microbacterium kunmingense]|uniref:hypothetical protein n=1 Tax=Microbacterium kunmingense TaxID=2915939 RepID=UPI002005CDFC|nr:hypothetical protein [Microbacterium kunmingense]
MSERLAVVAHEQAEQLKQERLAMAREGRWTGPESVTSSVGSVTDAGGGREHQKTTGGQKRDASRIAQGARRQAKRDAQ